MDDIWAELEAAGIDVTRVEKAETYDQGPQYVMRAPGPVRISFGGEYGGGMLLGWTYCSYDEEDGVIANDGGMALASIIPALLEWQRRNPEEETS